jgi:hypothetical protein
LTELLTPSFYADDERIRHAVARRTSFDVIHLTRHVELDVYLMRSDGLSVSALARALAAPPGPGPEETVRIASAEDVVFEKLRWYRMGGETSERQWLDVLGVLKVQRPTFDRACAGRWADGFGVADLLARAYQDAGYSA